jgi:hypothetical protein
MNDQVRERLGELMTSYGTGLYATPRMCEILLKQKCAEYPEEVQVLAHAVQAGTVQQLMRVRRGQDWEQVEAGLVNELVKAGAQEEPARWAVQSWAVALGKHPDSAPRPPEPKPDWNRLPEEQQSSNPDARRGAFYHPMMGAVCGASGAALGAATYPIALLTIVSSVVDALPIQTKADNAILFLIIVTLIFAVLGAVFGAMGGGFGLFLARAYAGETRGTLFWAKTGAFMGSMAGAAIGCYFCAFFGVIIGSLLGGWLGAFSSVKATLTRRW